MARVGKPAAYPEKPTSNSRITSEPIRVGIHLVIARSHPDRRVRGRRQDDAHPLEMRGSAPFGAMYGPVRHPGRLGACSRDVEARNPPAERRRPWRSREDPSGDGNRPARSPESGSTEFLGRTIAPFIGQRRVIHDGSTSHPTPKKEPRTGRNRLNVWLSITEKKGRMTTSTVGVARGEVPGLGLVVAGRTLDVVTSAGHSPASCDLSAGGLVGRVAIVVGDPSPSRTFSRRCADRLEVRIVGGIGFGPPSPGSPRRSCRHRSTAAPRRKR
jgi:hypothetical protein